MPLGRHHCKYCGEDLGVYQSYYGDIQTCDKSECIREATDEERDRDRAAMESAAEDGYERYR